MIISTPKTCGTSGRGLTVLSSARKTVAAQNFVAANQGVRLAVLGHERSEIVWLGHEIGGVGDFHARDSARIFQSAGKNRVKSDDINRVEHVYKAQVSRDFSDASE